MTEPKSLEERFWPKVDKSSNCWEWNAARMPAGYGIFTISKGGRWTNTYAHRISFEMHHGPIPEGHVVRHICDNPPCVNPNHLVSGTQAENIADIFERGRRTYFRREFCDRGHDDWKVYPDGGRRCKECFRIARRKRRAKAKLARMGDADSRGGSQ